MMEKDSYNDRFNRMKKSIEEGRDNLNEKFPDDVTRSGNPELLDKTDNDIDQNTNNGERINEAKKGS